MAVKLNLLPESYTLKGPIADLIKLIRPLNVILLAGFIIAGFGMGVYFIFSSITLSGLNKQNDEYKKQIQSLSTAQQQIVLLKDRLSQIKKAQSVPNVSKNITGISPIINLVTGNSYISELNVDSQKTTASIIFKSNADLTSFLKSVKENKDFANITLSTFNYSPANGYQVNLSFAQK